MNKNVRVMLESLCEGCRLPYFQANGKSLDHAVPLSRRMFAQKGRAVFHGVIPVGRRLFAIIPSPNTNKEVPTMKCPTCKTVDLVMSDRNGIEIDYCPQCRGVWLDRGELDKIIERSTSPAAHAQQQPAYGNQPAPHYQGHGHQDYGYPHQGHTQHHQHHKKREGFWGELFDFD